jgi:hypothetical protein
MARGAAASLRLAVCYAVTLSAGVGMIPFHKVAPPSKEDDWLCLISGRDQNIVLDMRSAGWSKFI